MSPAIRVAPGIKYSLGRVGLFVAIAIPVVLLTPKDMNFFLKLMIAAVLSSAIGIVALRQWRGEVANQVEASMAKRAAEKAKLRAALAGEPEASTEPPGGDAAAATDVSDAEASSADDADSDAPEVRAEASERSADKTRPAGRGGGSGRSGPSGTTRPGGRRPSR